MMSHHLPHIATRRSGMTGKTGKEETLESLGKDDSKRLASKVSRMDEMECRGQQGEEKGMLLLELAELRGAMIASEDENQELKVEVAKLGT